MFNTQSTQLVATFKRKILAALNFPIYIARKYIYIYKCKDDKVWPIQEPMQVLSLCLTFVIITTGKCINIASANYIVRYKFYYYLKTYNVLDINAIVRIYKRI